MNMKIITARLYNIVKAIIVTYNLPTGSEVPTMVPRYIDGTMHLICERKGHAYYRAGNLLIVMQNGRMIDSMTFRGEL